MNDYHDLKLILRSRFPLLVIETHEELKAYTLLEKLAREERQPLYRWSAADGLQHANFSYGGGADPGRRWEILGLPASAVPEPTSQPRPVEGTDTLSEALRRIEKEGEAGIYVLLDIHPYLDDPVIIRLLREIALEYPQRPRTLCLISPRLALPPELNRHAAHFRLRLPDLDALKRMAREEADLYSQQNGGTKVSAESGVFPLLLQHLVGMCEEDARRLVREAIRDDGAITRRDLARVVDTKHRLLDAGALELSTDIASPDDVGGMANLKRWLTQRRAAFFGEIDIPGSDAPKGMLLIGVQGAGKSLAAKTVAGGWSLPLLRLDFGALYNKWQGETERNLRKSLTAAESMAPCVLWLDEIEKGLATEGGESDGGVSRRVLGTLLTWMSERRGRVFLVATANDISRLPPELLRKGRFDEIFFVDLPGPAAREDIFRIHLRRRRLEPAGFDLSTLVSASEGYSGAEIEQAVVSALYEAHLLGETPATPHVLGEIQRTRPLSVLMAEQVNALRGWAASRTVRAD